MLTKDLIKVKSRTGRLYPSYQPLDNDELLSLAQGMIAIFNNSLDKSVAQLKEDLEAGGQSGHKMYGAFRKLLNDRTKEREPNPNISAARWKYIMQAQELRRQGYSEEISDHRDYIEKMFEMDFKSISVDIYSDLADNKKIDTFKTIKPTKLIHRYNCALIQGLLIHARTVSFTIEGASIGEKRAFFRAMKFQRLLADVEEKKGNKFVVTLSGPLALFQNTQAYGLRLANFFPHVLHFAKWKLEAEVKYKNKNQTLRVDQKCGISSHYKKTSGYIPDEFVDFLNAFNEKSKDWQAEFAQEFLDLGKQSYCLPDLMLKKGKKIVYVELFHNWHWAQFNERLKVLEASGCDNLILGVSKNIAKKPELEAAASESKIYDKQVLVFTNFPTPKSLISYADQL